MSRHSTVLLCLQNGAEDDQNRSCSSQLAHNQFYWLNAAEEEHTTLDAYEARFYKAQSLTRGIGDSVSG